MAYNSYSIFLYYTGRCGPIDQAGMGIAISAQYSVAKLYNDPLLKTSTSLVAGRGWI